MLIGSLARDLETVWLRRKGLGRGEHNKDPSPVPPLLQTVSFFTIDLWNTGRFWAPEADGSAMFSRDVVGRRRDASSDARKSACLCPCTTPKTEPCNFGSKAFLGCCALLSTWVVVSALASAKPPGTSEGGKSCTFKEASGVSAEPSSVRSSFRCTGLALGLDGPAELFGETSSSDFPLRVTVSSFCLYAMEAFACPFLLLRGRPPEDDDPERLSFLIHTGLISLKAPGEVGFPSIGPGRLSAGCCSRKPIEFRSLLSILSSVRIGETELCVNVLPLDWLGIVASRICVSC